MATAQSFFVPSTQAVLKIHKATFVQRQCYASRWLNCVDLCGRPEETSRGDLAEAVWSHRVGKGGMFYSRLGQSLQSGISSQSSALR